jgi:hypothetical protein
MNNSMYHAHQVEQRRAADPTVRSEEIGPEATACDAVPTFSAQVLVRWVDSK